MTSSAEESGTRIVFEKPGVFHTPAPGAESQRFEIPMSAAGRFRRIVVEVDVTPGGWRARSEKKTNHAVLWLNRGSKWRGNVFGYVNLFGPTRPRVKMANNVGQPAGTMLSQTRTWTAKPGRTYRFRYEYDAANGKVELTVSDAGKVVAQLAEQATVERIASDPHNDDAQPGFFIVFGHPADSAGPEVPTYGWKYADLRVVFE